MKSLTFPCLVQEVTDLAYRRTEKERKSFAQWAGRYLVKAQSYGDGEEESYRVSIFFTTHTVSELPMVGQVIEVQVQIETNDHPGEIVLDADGALVEDGK